MNVEYVWVHRSQLPPEVTVKLYHGVNWLKVSKTWYHGITTKDEAPKDAK